MIVQTVVCISCGLASSDVMHIRHNIVCKIVIILEYGWAIREDPTGAG